MQPLANTIDPTFANGGSVTLSFTAEAVAVQADGKVLAAGLMSGSPAGGNEAVIERLNSDGTPDTTFGAAGTAIVTDAVEADEAFYGLAIQTDGRVIASGTSNGKFLLIRFNTDGSLDPAFGAGGRVTTTLAGSTGNTTGIAYGVGLEPDGGINVGGNAGSQFSAAGYTSTGAPDTGFNNGTPTKLTAGGATSGAGDVLGQIVVQTDGKVIGAGATGDHVFVTRINGDGTLDRTFNSRGSTPGVLVLDNLGAAPLATGTPDFTEGLAIDGSGNILVANHTIAGHFGTVRIKPTGAIDTAFGASGLAGSNLGGSDDIDMIAVQSDGRILVAGTTTSAGVTRAALAEYRPDGITDPTFGNGGIEVFDTGLPAAVAAATAGAAAGASDARPGGASPSGARPDAEGLSAILQKVFGAQQPDGRLLAGASQANASANVSTLRRLLVTPFATPTGTPTPLPTGTLGAALNTTVPSSVVAGAPAKAKVSVKVTAPASGPVNGSVTITLYVSQAQSLNGATQVATLTKKLRLKAGRSRRFNVKVSSFPQVPAGTYYLLAAVTAPDNTTTGVAGPTQVTIGPAAIRIAGSNLRPPAAATAGRKAAATLTLQNTGNVNATGTVNVTLTATGSASGSVPQTLATVPLKVRLKPNATRTFRLRFTVPTALTAGSYTLSAALDVSALGGNATSAGTVTAATPLVVA